jgi:hypothetical protein
MRVENDPRVKLQRLVLAAVLKGIDQDIAARCSGEDGKPGDGSCGDKVGLIAFEDSVAAAHGGGEA